MKTGLKKFAAAVGVGFGLTVAAASSQAALWSFEDDDITFILNSAGTLKSTTSSVAVGDVYLSVFEIPVFRIDGSNAIPTGMELTGIAAVQVATATDIDVRPGFYQNSYTFSPWLGLNTFLSANGYVGPTMPAGAIMAMFLNDTTTFDLDLNRTSNPATNCTSLSDCVQKAATGDLLQIDGFAGDPDEFWIGLQTLPLAVGTSDIANALATGNATLVATFNFGLSNLYNAVTPVGFQNVFTSMLCPGVTTYAADNCVQFNGSGTLTGGQGLSNGAIAHSDFDAQKYVVSVSEPGTLLILGAGLLGFGAGYAAARVGAQCKSLVWPVPV